MSQEVLDSIKAQGVAAVVQHISEFGHKANSDVRVISAEQMTVGKSIRQGDIYITRLKDAPKGVVPLAPTSESGYQLAPGNTKGSRHCVSSTNVKAFTLEKPGITDGPVIVASDRFSLTHPEHAWFDLPAGTYQVTYQLDFVRQQRSKD